MTPKPTAVLRCRYPGHGRPDEEWYLRTYWMEDARREPLRPGEIVLIGRHPIIRDAQPGQAITLGAFRLRVLEYDPQRRAFLATPDGLAGLWRLAHWLVVRRWQWLEARLILTLAVWGLADWPPDLEVPTWSLVKLFRRKP